MMLLFTSPAGRHRSVIQFHTDRSCRCQTGDGYHQDQSPDRTCHIFLLHAGSLGAETLVAGLYACSQVQLFTHPFSSVLRRKRMEGKRCVRSATVLRGDPGSSRTLDPPCAQTLELRSQARPEDEYPLRHYPSVAVPTPWQQIRTDSNWHRRATQKSLGCNTAWL